MADDKVAPYGLSGLITGEDQPSSGIVRPPGQVAPPPVPEGQSDYMAAVKARGQPYADEWKAEQMGALASQGKSPSEIRDFFGDGPPKTAAIAAHTETQFRRNTGQSTDPNVPLEHPPVNFNWWDAFSVGYSHSLQGEIDAQDAKEGFVRGFGSVQPGQLKGPTTLPAHANILEKSIAWAGKMSGDAPSMLYGALGGAFAAPATGLTGIGFGAGALPAAEREMLTTEQNNGNIKGHQDYVQGVAQSTWHILQGGAETGLVMVPAAKGGELAAAGVKALGGGRLAVAAADTVANSGAFAVGADIVSNAMKDKLPDWDSFRDGFLTNVVLGVVTHGVAHAPDVVATLHANAQDLFRKTGIPPQEVAPLVQTDPVIRGEMSSQDPSTGETVTPTLRTLAPSDPLPMKAEPTPYASHKAKLLTSGAAVPTWSARGTLPDTTPLAHEPYSAREIIQTSALETNPGMKNRNTVVSKPIAGYTKGGAIGAHQITLGFARTYVPGARDMTDQELTAYLDTPQGNQRAFDLGMSDIERRYPGDPAAQLAAYNGGNKVANRFLTEGHGTQLEAIYDKTQKGGFRYEEVPANRNESHLPLETQRYLAKARYYAGGVLKHPDQLPSNQDDDMHFGYDPEQYDRSTETATGRAAEVNFEVAPNPDNADLVGKWGQLGDDEKTELSRNVAHEIVPQVADAVGLKPNEWSLGDRRGAFEGGEPEHSFGFSVDHTAKAKEASDIMGYALSQKAMMVEHGNYAAKGSERSAILAIPLPREGAEARAHDLYANLSRPGASDLGVKGYTLDPHTGLMKIAFPGEKASAFEGTRLEDIKARVGSQFADDVKLSEANVSMNGDYHIDPKNIPLAMALRARVNTTIRKYMMAKEAGTPLTGPTQVASSAGAASLWDKDTSTLDDADREILSNVGEPAKPPLVDPERLSSLYFSELAPARAIDNKLIAAADYNRIKEMGTEDHLRQTYGSDARASTFVKLGRASVSLDKSGNEVFGLDESAPTFDKALKQAIADGGNVQGFKAAILAQRAYNREVLGTGGKIKIEAAKAAKVAYGTAQKIADGAQKDLDTLLAKAKPAGKGTALEGDREAILNSELYKTAEKRAIQAGKDANQAKYVMQRAIKKATPTDTGFNPFAVVRKVEDPETQRVYGKAMDMWTQTHDGVGQYMQDSGLLDAAGVRRAAMRDIDPTYTPFRALVGDESAFSRPAPGGTFNPLRGMIGNDGKVIDPIVSSVDNTRIAVRAADRNRAAAWVENKALADPKYAATIGYKRTDTIKDPNNDEIDKALIKYGFDPDDEAGMEKAREAFGPLIAQRQEVKLSNNEVMIFRDGHAGSYELENPAFAKLLRNRGTMHEAGPVEGVARWFAQTQRAGITLDPTFGPRMALWHQFNQYSLDPYHPVPIMTFLRGAIHVFSNGGAGDAIAHQVMVNGGFGAALADMDTNWLKEDLDGLLEKTGAWDRMWNVVRHPIEAAHAVNVRLDQANRVGLTLGGMKSKGVTILKAATQGRKAGIDYAERASAEAMNILAQDIPFFRPHFLGMKQGYEAFENNGDGSGPAAGIAQKTLAAGQIGLNTIARWMGTISVAAGVMWVLNKMQDESLPENRKFENIDRWEKDSMLITPEIFGQRIKLRYPANVGFVFGGMTTRLLDAMFNHDPEATMGMMSTFMQGFIPGLLPPIALPAVENITNHSFMTNRPLVPGALQDLAPNMRYTENTSDTAKALAPVINMGLGWLHEPDAQVSPIQIDNMVRGWNGTMGSDALRVLDWPSGKHQPMDFESSPFVRSFFVQYQDYQAPVSDFYKEAGEVMAKWEALPHLKQVATATGDPADKKAYADAQADVIATPRQGQIIQKYIAIKKQREVIIGIEHNNDMTRDEKRQQIGEAMAQMIVISKAGLEEIRGK